MHLRAEDIRVEVSPPPEQPTSVQRLWKITHLPSGHTVYLRPADKAQGKEVLAKMLANLDRQLSRTGKPPAN